MVTRQNRHLRLVRFIWALVFAAVAIPTVATAQRRPSPFAVESKEKSGLYSLGQEVIFTVERAGNSEAVSMNKVNVTITRDGWEKIAAPQMKRNGDALEVCFTPEAPGWYMCEASFGDDNRGAARAGALVSPEKITASMPEPKDFDEFWNARRAALAATPLKAELAPVDSREPQIECFSIEAPCPQTNPVRGYYARPKGAGARTCPAILLLRAAGVAGDWCKASPRNTALLAKQYGAIVVDINAHGMLNGQPQEYYRSLEEGELSGYWAGGRTTGTSSTSSGCTSGFSAPLSLSPPKRRGTARTW